MGKQSFSVSAFSLSVQAVVPPWLRLGMEDLLLFGFFTAVQNFLGCLGSMVLMDFSLASRSCETSAFLML